MATQTPVELKQSGGKATVVLPADTIYLVFAVVVLDAGIRKEKL